VADCWGNNQFGQAGSDPAQFSPVPATLATMFGSSVGRVKTEDNFTCVDQTNGTVQCIGYGGWGQLGNGQFVSTHVPQSVGNGQALQGVDTGTNHACALDPNGNAYCWGNGNWGNLGNSATGAFASPVAVGGGHTYRAIAAGYLHTCAIGTDNHIYCWGSNTYGQLGTQYPGGWVWSPVQAIDP
jgi:alpha-tubulin suppressor-like RCC1 family protein